MFVNLNGKHTLTVYYTRVITKWTRFTNNKPLLDRLHWLPIACRIALKIATLTYKQCPSLAKRVIKSNLFCSISIASNLRQSAFWTHKSLR